MGTSKTKWQQNLLLAVVSTVFALIVAELLIRLVLPAPTEQSWNHAEIQDVGYTQFHDQRLLGEANSLGLRGAEYSLDYDGYRILAMGDSFTYGYKLDDKSSWPRLTEVLLNQSGDIPFQVLNGGRPGTDTRWQVDFFKQYTSQYKPDMVVVGFLINDCTELCSHCGAVKAKVKMGKFIQENDPRTQSQFVFLLKMAMMKRTLNQETIREFSQPYTENSDSLQQCKNAFRELKQLSDTQGFQLVVVIYPMLFELGPHYPFYPIHNQMLDFWKREGISGFDLTPVFYGKKDTDLWVQSSDSHPNANANSIAAQRIAEIVRDNLN